MGSITATSALQAFNEIDKNGNGVIGRGELSRKARKALGGHGFFMRVERDVFVAKLQAAPEAAAAKVVSAADALAAAEHKTKEDRSLLRSDQIEKHMRREGPYFAGASLLALGLGKVFASTALVGAGVCGLGILAVLAAVAIGIRVAHKKNYQGHIIKNGTMADLRKQIADERTALREAKTTRHVAHVALDNATLQLTAPQKAAIIRR
jgi:hypothetical protein